MKYEDLQITLNTDENRIELEVEGSTAFIEYKINGDRLTLIHTEVPPELEGKGVGTAIVQKALQYAKNNHYKVRPFCPFVQSYLKRHPEWNEIIY